MHLADSSVPEDSRRQTKALTDGYSVGTLAPWEMLSNEEEEDFRQYVIAKIMGDPAYRLTQEYFAQHRKPDEMNTVEGIIANKTMWAYLLTEPSGEFSTDLEELATAAFRHRLALPMLEAIPYFWNTDIFQLMGETELPRHTISAQLPFGAAWFRFDCGLKVRGIKDPNKLSVGENLGEQWHHNVIQGILAIQGENKLRMVLLGHDTKTIENFCAVMDVMQGAIYPDDIAMTGRMSVRRLLSCISFINSPYIVLDKKTICRQARRRVGFHAEVPESVKPRFIELRTPLYKRDYEQSHAQIDWKFRWLVRGHHRAQWCPSTKDHKLMWIAPYVKGPEGMPMKTTAYKVIR